jgi:hypothetical protein
MPSSTFCRSRWWKLVFEYFPILVYQQVDHQVPSSDTIIVSCHPHGVMAASRMLLYGGLWENLFPRHTKVGLSPLFCSLYLLHLVYGREEHLQQDLFFIYRFVESSPYGRGA